MAGYFATYHFQVSYKRDLVKIAGPMLVIFHSRASKHMIIEHSGDTWTLLSTRKHVHTSVLDCTHYQAWLQYNRDRED